ncbi:hypothetical protein K458DRAFT_159971 [Lentithecium fluviatile CBS 122367]|uniref:Uncharacterized protein n=1 Tax=Lentithecium fluviatile CBS 122367 TaxID=1168545 RepID=A0A6G1IGY7_9PLEO|nr:hypothetical protein K458DRAFT_159971 [Lentithecium fluviatile CBS 122367]
MTSSWKTSTLPCRDPDFRTESAKKAAPPSLASLQDYRGLILSCQQIYKEVEHEYVQMLSRFLSTIHQQWLHENRSLRIFTPTRISDSTHIRIGIPSEGLSSVCTTEVLEVLGCLARNLPSFQLCLYYEPEMPRRHLFSFLGPLMKALVTNSCSIHR